MNSNSILGMTACVLALSLSGCSDDGDENKSGSGGSGAKDSGATGGGAGTGGSGGSGGGSGGASGGSGGSAGAGTGGSAGGSAMSFFVSSTPPSGTGDLGGLSGVDAHCKALAQAAGSTKTQWVAYLSAGGVAPVHAKDRIGSGPWFNAKGAQFAANLTALHPTVDPTQDRAGYIAVKPADELFMDETGAAVPSAEHDILTGSNADGTLFDGRTCADWTSAQTADKAQVGHSDTPNNTQFSPSWNSAHDSENCSEAGLIARGGNGRIYCFATD